MRSCRRSRNRLGGSEAREVTVPLSDGATIAWLYRHGDVRSREDDGDVARLPGGAGRRRLRAVRAPARALTPGRAASYKRRQSRGQRKHHEIQALA